MILSNSGSPSHGYMAVKTPPSKPGKRARSHVPPAASFGGVRHNARQSPLPGSDSLFTFGKHRGLTYERVLYTYPGYVLWGQREKVSIQGFWQTFWLGYMSIL